MNRLFRRAASAVAAPKSSPARAARRPRPLSLQVESVERRELMAANFLQGVAFVDNNSNSVFDQGDAPKPNTTIQLFSSTNPTTPLASTVTNAEGYYRFDNLSAGKYKLVEVASDGYVATNAQVNAVFNTGAWNGQSIDVTVADATTAAPVMVARTPGIAGGLTGVNTAYVLTSGNPAANQFTPNPDVTNAHQFQAQMVAANGITPVSSSFYTYCMDLYHIAPGYYGAFTVTPETVPQNLPPAVTTNLGQIGWLYNHYGKNLASSGADGAGLQLALYELVYDSTPNLTSGGFVVDQSKTDPTAFAAAQNYLKLAAGHDERAIFLNTIDPIDTINPATWGTQGFITTESYNFSNTRSASIGDTVFLDKNANGIQDAGDTGIANVTVNLYNADNKLVGTQTTDSNGKYLFSGLIPGTYSVQFVAPNSSYTFSPKNQGTDVTLDSDANSNGFTGTYNLVGGLPNTTVDAGLYQTASLGDYVFVDNNANGVQDTGDTPLSGVTVTLTDSNGKTSTATTDGNGNYLFPNLVPGTYSVQFTAPGYTFTAQNKGTDNTIDSNADSKGNAGSYTLASGQNNLTVDAGVYKLAAIGDTVFLDKNGNGIQDTGDTGVGGVTVNLLDSTGKVINTTTTNSSGNYLFNNLVPGTYAVQFVKPAGYNFTQKSQVLTGAVDSDADTATGKTGNYTLASGQTNLTVDAGLTIITGSISGTKYRDLTGNGLTSDDTPLAGVKIYIDSNNNGQCDPGEQSTITKADGTYSFANVAPGTYTVREVVGAGWVRTGPTNADNYCVTVSAGKDSDGNDFANAEAGCDCQIYCVTYIINGCRQVSDLRGNVNPGDSVVARFSVRNASASNPAVFSLVSYVAPNSYFSAGNASQQYVYDMATGTYTSNGTYSLQVDVPDSYFQVDFVCGQVINKFGPAGSNIFYSAQNRLISADNDGCKTYDNLLDKKDTGTADFWAGCYGQNLIKGLNSGSTSKTLGNWLASNFPNLYGSLAGKTNADIACIMQSINNSCYQLEADVLATALSIYVTDADLAGMNAVGYGFHVSFLGSGAKKVNVGSTGVFLGLNSNSFYSLYDLIDAADNKASKGIILGSSSYGRSKVGGLFSAVNCAGSIC